MPRGQCTLPTDDGGRILDRLAGLEHVISPDFIRQALVATRRVDSRRCLLTHEVVLWIVLAMGLFTEVPIRQVFKLSQRFREGEPTPHRSSLCAARKRLGIAPLRELFARVVRPLARPDTPGAFAFGFRLVGLDSTVYDLPDSPANDAAFGRPGGGRGDGAFPQFRKLSLVELGTHAELGLVLRPHLCNERTMVPGLLKLITPEMLVLLDRGFVSCAMWRELAARGAQILARATIQITLRPHRLLADGSYLSKVYEGESDRKNDRNGLVVRVIRYTLADPQRVGHGEEHVLVTTLLDESLYPAIELIVLYHERWEHEHVFDEQKTHQDPPRPTKPAHLRSESPSGVIQEIYALSLGHYVTRALMSEAAATAGLDPDRLSFTGTLQILKCRLPECDAGRPERFEAWYRALLWEIRHEGIESRRNRINSRVIKRKFSNWRKKQPEDRNRPPLKKTFRETVVMIH